jgi:hypothetical protein
MIHGRAGPAVAAAVVLVVYTAVARVPRAAGARAAARRRPAFHAFLVRRLGDPRSPFTFLARLTLRPLAAPSFARFWREWNPPLAYVLLYFVYRPVRRHLPRRAALFLTFVASGFVLHDLPANGADVLRGRIDLSGSLLLALFGVLALATDALGMDLSRRPAWVRVLANGTLVAAGFALRRAVLAMIS